MIDKTKPWTQNVFTPNFFDDLFKAVPWERRSDAPRYECWMMSGNGRPYTYGRGRGQRTYTPWQMENVDRVAAIAAAVAIVTDADRPPNGCFANMYENSRDHLGWHSDNDPGIDHRYPIVSVSFGQVRKIQFRPVRGEGETSLMLKSQEITMESGSVTVMPPGFQQTHQHCIPKGNFEMQPRISLTYRWLLP